MAESLEGNLVNAAVLEDWETVDKLIGEMLPNEKRSLHGTLTTLRNYLS